MITEEEGEAVDSEGVAQSEAESIPQAEGAEEVEEAEEAEEAEESEADAEDSEDSRSEDSN